MYKNVYISLNGRVRIIIYVKIKKLSFFIINVWDNSEEKIILKYSLKCLPGLLAFNFASFFSENFEPFK